MPIKSNKNTITANRFDGIRTIVFFIPCLIEHYVRWKSILSLKWDFSKGETAEFFDFNQIFNQKNQFNQKNRFNRKNQFNQEKNTCFQLFSIGSIVIIINSDFFDCPDFLIYLIFLIALISV